jgi:hypothetical protein
LNAVTLIVQGSGVAMSTFERSLILALMVILVPACTTAEMSAGRTAHLDDLRPGQYSWQPERAPAGPVEIVVSLGSQRAYIFRSGTLIGTSTISSGRRGHESPVGRFEILQKSRVHRSNRYENAPMPWMQRLNWFGVALHGGKVPGYPASHGCIRLPMKLAEALYGATELGGFVFITEGALGSPQAALKLARANASAPMSADRRRRSLRAGRNG